MRNSSLTIISLALLMLGFLWFINSKTQLERDNLFKQDMSIENRSSLINSKSSKAPQDITVVEEAFLNKDERKSDAEVLFDYRMQKNKGEKESKQLGYKRLEELIGGQAHELNILFELGRSWTAEKYPRVELNKIQDGFKFIDRDGYADHLAQEKTSDWSILAESYLQTQFLSSKNPIFTVFRTDCRISSCEVSGIVTHQRSKSVHDAKLELRDFLFVNLSNKEGYEVYFTNQMIPQVSLIRDKENYPLPFSTIIYRATPFTVKSNPNP